jgi:hypothetical protein
MTIVATLNRNFFKLSKLLLLKYVGLRSLLRFPYVHVYVRFTKLVLSLRQYDTVARADNYFAEYRMLFLRRHSNERILNSSSVLIKGRFLILSNAICIFL